MSWQELTKGRALPWATTALCALAIARSAAAAPTLEEVAKGVNVDASQISVSGISSGGFMAHQFHVAHSDHIMGAGIVAGGPYYCAKGNILDAVTRCSSFVMLECTKVLTKLGQDPSSCKKTDKSPQTEKEIEDAARASFQEAGRQEEAGNISKRAHLKNAKIYLFRGTEDSIVPAGVMDTLFHFYADRDKAGVKLTNIDYNSKFPARHTMVRDGFDKPTGGVVGDCVLPPDPAPPVDKNAFIDDCTRAAEKSQTANSCVCPITSAGRSPCPPTDKRTVCKSLKDVDLAGSILKKIYGKQALKVRMSVEENEILPFDQKRVFASLSTAEQAPVDLQNASMAKEGYIFIPERCRDGRSCKLHVAFHGCLQGLLQGGKETDQRSGHSGNLFSKYAGYNEWAAANDIIVLYPQIEAWSTFPINPQGCWDWWGQEYTGTGSYHTRPGKQIRAVAQMINILAGSRKLLDVPAE